jgi:DNA-binding IscR family transcriptional regulator
MNYRQRVQFAVQCLEELEAHAQRPVSFQDISQKQSIPLAECTLVVRQLADAGIVSLKENGTVALERPIDEITALELLTAVWTRDRIQPAFRMLVGEDRGPVMRKTLKFVRLVQSVGAEGDLHE